LDDLSRSDISRYFFAGDIVGYGADPSLCIGRLRALDPVMVAGNHDWAVSGRLSTAYFNESARAAVEWSGARLSGDEKIFLDHLPLVREVQEEDLCLVHGTLARPEEFDYMTDAHQAAKTFYCLRQKICFVGHLHQPGIFVENPAGVSYKPGRGKFVYRENERWIVNVGSVGQPRDGDPRACVCVLDTGEGAVEFRRLEYDVEAAASKIRAAGLPEALAARLFSGY